MHLLEGPDYGHSMIYYDEKLENIEEDEKSTAPSGIRTHDLMITRRVLYRYATTTASIAKRYYNKLRKSPGNVDR